LLGLAVAVGCFVVWIAQAYRMGNRHDWLAWPTGILIGLTMIRTARAGSWRMGLIAAGLTFAVFAAIAVPATFLVDYAPRHSAALSEGYAGLPMREWEWYHILKASRVGFFAQNNLFWGFMGCVTAYRFASRKAREPAGTGLKPSERGEQNREIAAAPGSVWISRRPRGPR
jgi:hypothetical protein